MKNVLINFAVFFGYLFIFGTASYLFWSFAFNDWNFLYVAQASHDSLMIKRCLFACVPVFMASVGTAIYSSDKETETAMQNIRNWDK